MYYTGLEAPSRELYKALAFKMKISKTKSFRNFHLFSFKIRVAPYKSELLLVETQQWWKGELKPFVTIVNRLHKNISNFRHSRNFKKKINLRYLIPSFAKMLFIVFGFSVLMNILSSRPGKGM